MVWRCHGVLCIYVHFSIFLFRSNVSRGYLDESDFRHCFGNFFESALRRFPDHSWVNVSLQQSRNNIDNSILKDILQLKVLRTWIKIHANSFIKTWVNIMKRESTKVPWKLSLEKKYDPALQGTLYRNRSYLTCYYMLLLLSY